MSVRRALVLLCGFQLLTGCAPSFPYINMPTTPVPIVESIATSSPEPAATPVLTMPPALATSSTPTPSPTPTLSPSASFYISPSTEPQTPLPDFPIIDGSSSTINMHEAIRNYLSDEYILAPQPQHSQTYDALERLIPGSGDPADVVLAVKYYDDTLKDAKARGADLVITPIAKEGFVFVVHNDNPITSLTQQQIRDIYSGRIKNWMDVGGKDEEIILFTRNIDSGSETAMQDFMGGIPFVEGYYTAIKTMEGILFSVREIGSAAIGYNILSWSVAQELEEFDVKTVAVDGVAPTNETLADSSYPLMVYTYSYYNKENEKGKNLTEWLLTEEGQKVITSADYVGINGELPSKDDPAAFDKIYADSYSKAMAYYDGSGFMLREYFIDRASIKALSNGKSKDVTIIWLAFRYHPEDEQWRFIVLTRDKNGEFEVINEGDADEYMSKYETQTREREAVYPPV